MTEVEERTSGLPGEELLRLTPIASGVHMRLKSRWKESFLSRDRASEKCRQ